MIISETDNPDGSHTIKAQVKDVETGEDTVITSTTWVPRPGEPGPGTVAKLIEAGLPLPDSADVLFKDMPINLVVERRAKLYQGSRGFCVSKNGENVGQLPNGGMCIVKNVVQGDSIEISYNGTYKSPHKTPYNTLTLKVRETSRRKHLSVRVKKTGDITFYLVLAAAFMAVASLFMGFLFGLIPLPVALIFSGSSICKYCRDGEFGKEIVLCRTRNRDIENGSLFIVQDRPQQSAFN